MKDKLMTAQFPVEDRAEMFHKRLVGEAQGFYAKDIKRHGKTVTWTLDLEALVAKLEEYGLLDITPDPIGDYCAGMRQTIAWYGSDATRRALLNGRVCIEGTM